MQKNPRYQKTRNKNRNHQMSYDSPEGEGEFLNESNDSMLSVSDSLGNMGSYDSSITTEIDRTLLDEFAGDSDLSAENDFILGDESAPERGGASKRKPQARKYAGQRPLKEPKIAAKRNVSSSKNGQNMQDQIAPSSSKVSKAVLSYREDLQGKVKEIYAIAKKQSRGLDEKIRTQPYFLALAAVVAGFALARLIQSGPMKR